MAEYDASNLQNRQDDAVFAQDRTKKTARSSRRVEQRTATDPSGKYLTRYDNPNPKLVAQFLGESEMHGRLEDPVPAGVC